MHCPSLLCERACLRQTVYHLESAIKKLRQVKAKAGMQVESLHVSELVFAAVLVRLATIGLQQFAQLSIRGAKIVMVWVRVGDMCPDTPDHNRAIPCCKTSVVRDT